MQHLEFVHVYQFVEHCGVQSFLLRSPPGVLMSVLNKQEDLLENILGCIPVGQIVTIKPLSEDFCYVLGYLLTWKLILTFFKAASSQVNNATTFGSFVPLCISITVILGKCLPVRCNTVASPCMFHKVIDL